MNEKRMEVKQLRTLFKYSTDSPKILEDLFRKNKIRFTQPAALNDPLEFNPYIRFDSDGDQYRPFQYHGIQCLVYTIGIC